MSDEGQSKPQTPLDILRHSTAHVMAKAVQRLYPGSMLAIGPPIEDGFYYDIDVRKQLGRRTYRRLKRRWRRSSPLTSRSSGARSPARTRWQRTRRAARSTRSRSRGICRRGEVTSFYDTGSDWTDLCRGPHVPATSEIKAFKLLSVAGAYWRGDEKRPMLQRIYGTAWPSQES